MAVPDEPDDRPRTICEPPAQTSEFRRTLTHQVIVGLVALVCLTAFASYPTGLAAISGVLVLAGCAFFLERHSAPEPKLPVRGKAVFVTGCDTGFGHELAKYLASIGVTVFAGCLFESGPGAQDLRMHSHARLHVLQCDVTSDEQVVRCVDVVKRKIGDEGLWGVVNNAGLNFLGDVELTTMAQFQKVADINIMGMVRVTKAFIPLVRKAKGRFVNVTSVKGLLSFPHNAAYGLTKFAGEAFSDILRLEMNKFGVKVAVIEPCNFGGATGCLNMARISQDFEEMWTAMDDNVRETYGKEYVDAHVTAARDCVPTAQFNLFPVIEAMTHALLAPKPKVRYLIPGGSEALDKYWIYGKLAHVVPSPLMDWLLDCTGFPLPAALQRNAQQS